MPSVVTEGIKGEKIYIDFNTKPEVILERIDWDNFNYKHWRFLHNVVYGVLVQTKLTKGEEGSSETAYDKVFRVFNSKIRIKQAIDEVARLLGRRVADRVNLFANDILNDTRWKLPFKEWEIRDAIFGALNSHLEQEIVEQMDNESLRNMFFGSLDFIKAGLGKEEYLKYMANQMR